MARWMATIGELDRAWEFEGCDFSAAKGIAIEWALGQRVGAEVQLWPGWTTTDEPERCTLAVAIPITERTLRPWPLSLFKRWRVKTRTIIHQTTLALALVHDEMTAAERDEFCESVGLI